MKKILLGLAVSVCFASMVFSQFSFYLIDNFESGKFEEGSKWWVFGNIKGKIVKNPTLKVKDLIAKSCGDYALNVSGRTSDWYVGGLGADIGIDASEFSRFQIDVSGDPLTKGKLIIELLEDDNGNFTIEQDPENNYEPVKDDKWVAEIKILGKGFTRTSIPFTAFRDANPKVGDGKWNPDQKGGSGGLLKLQLILVTDEKEGNINLNLDNILITY
jgi:hypothetical protein